MMKLGIIRGIDNESFDYVKRRNLDFIELCLNSRQEAANVFNNIGLIKSNISRTGIPIGSVGRWAAKPNAGGKIDAEEMANLTSLLDAAIAVKSPVFVCGCNYDPNISMFKNYSAAIELFGTILEKVKGLDIKIAIYNCDWENFVYQPSAWEIVIGELPDLMIKYDCSHSFGRGHDYLAELSDWGHKVAHMHIKGAVKAGGKYVDDPPAGIDAISWSQVFAIMYSRKYDGGLSIEPHSATWRADSELGEKGIGFTVDYIRKFIL